MRTQLFIDIDGTLIAQNDHVANRMANRIGPTMLPSTRQKLIEWERAGHMIILTTGRKECMRRQTEKELAKLGIFYDLLIMGLGIGKRVLINDMKPDSDVPMAYAINLKRNEGIADVTLP